MPNGETKSYTSAEIKSGLMVTLAIILLIGLTFIVGKLSRGRTEPWLVRFGYVSGLAQDAPVHYAGREVGRVSKIEVVQGEEKPILVTVQISDQAQLHNGAGAFIDTLGLMGEKFVEITPGTISGPLLKKGTVIEGSDPIPMYVLIGKANGLADRMEELTQSLNPLVGNINKTLEGHEEELGRIIANLESSSANLRDMTQDLKSRPWRLLRKG